MTKVFVAGATGKQGGATARALLDRGFQVQALVRQPSSDAALVLQSQGARLFQGSWDQPDTVAAAMAGAEAAFWQSQPSFADMDEEVRGASNIIEAARQSGTVKHLIYSTVVGVDRLGAGFDDWKANPFMARYWENKASGEAKVRGSVNDGSCIQNYTILRPVNFMTNYLLPDVTFQYPTLAGKEGVQNTCIPADYELSLVDIEDIGRVVAAAVADPVRFNGRELEIRSDRVKVGNIIRMLGEATGRDLKLHILSPEEAEAQVAQNPVLQGEVGFMGLAAVTPQWQTAPFDEFGLGGFTSFEQFLEREASALARTYNNDQVS